MARAVVLTKQRMTKIDSITIDACKDEAHTLTNTVTDHPVEEGFNVSDHSRPDPDVVTLSCFVSNTPISSEQRTRAVQEGSVSFNTTAQNGVPIGAVDGRADTVFKQLKKLRDEGTLIQIVTTLKTYGVSSTEGMMITNLNISRTSKNFDGLEFTITLKQIRIVRNRQTRDSQPRDKRTGEKKKQGAKTPAETETPDSLALRGGRYLSPTIAQLSPGN